MLESVLLPSSETAIYMGRLTCVLFRLVPCARLVFSALVTEKHNEMLDCSDLSDWIRR